jgi:hypothetical protein
MNDFEELARRGVEAADDSVRRLPVPDIVARRRRRPVVLGLALGVLLFVVGVVVWQSGDDSTPTAVGPETAVEGPAVDGADTSASDAPNDSFRLEWVDSGKFELEAAREYSLGGSDSRSPASTKLYGLGPEEQPFADADLLLVTFATEGENEFTGEEIAVRGTTGWRDATIGGLGFENVIAWNEPAGPSAIAASRTMGFDELLTVVESLEVTDAGATPDGLSLDFLAEIDSLPFNAAGNFDAWQLAYRARSMPGDDESADGMSLIAVAGGDGFALVRRYMFAPDALPVIVRGTMAWLTDAQQLEPIFSRQLIWSERGFSMSLSTFGGLDPVEIAESLVEIDDARWAELVAGTEEVGRQIDREIELIAQGEFEAEDGTVKWRVAIDESLSLCLAIEQANSGSGSCGSIGSESESGEVFAPPGLGAVSASVGADWLEIQGSVGEEVARVVAEFPDGTAADLDLYASEVLETRVVGWVTPLRQGDGDYELVAYATDGRELERRVLAGFVPSGPVEEVPTPIIPELPEQIQGVVLDEGEVDDLRWALRDNNGELCLFVLADVGAGTCGTGFQWVQSTGPDAGSRLHVSGVVGDCVASVDLVQSRGDGEIVSESSDAVADESRVFFVWTQVEDPANQMTLVLRDADGASIAELDARGVAQLEELC